MAEAPQKSDQAFKTIGELADELGVPQHILRYWETRFPQLRPLQRAGNRRYYRPADVALAQRIHRLLNKDGYTIRGVQQVLSGRSATIEPAAPAAPEPAFTPLRPQAPMAEAAQSEPVQSEPAGIPVEDLRALRNQLAQALADSTPS
jgi:DNA-binding transcriptional MerR regulator